MPSPRKDDLLRVLAENIYRVDGMRMYLRGALKINREAVRQILLTNDGCKLIGARFALDFKDSLPGVVNDVPGIIDNLLMIAHTDRVFMPSQDGKE